jgi:hypothetical protein
LLYRSAWAVSFSGVHAEYIVEIAQSMVRYVGCRHHAISENSALDRMDQYRAQDCRAGRFGVSKYDMPSLCLELVKVTNSTLAAPLTERPVQ